MFQNRTRTFNTSSGQWIDGIEYSRFMKLTIIINPRSLLQVIDLSHHIHISQINNRFIDTPIYLWIENTDV